MPAPFPDKLSSVALSPRTPNGRPLADIQHPELYRGGIRHQTHLSTKSIYLSDNLSLSNATNGRIARHLCNLVHVHRHQTGLSTHIGTGAGCLATRMTSSNDNHIVFQYHTFTLSARKNTKFFAHHRMVLRKKCNSCLNILLFPRKCLPLQINNFSGNKNQTLWKQTKNCVEHGTSWSTRGVVSF